MNYEKPQPLSRRIAATGRLEFAECRIPAAGSSRGRHLQPWFRYQQAQEEDGASTDVRRGGDQSYRGSITSRPQYV